MLLYLEPIFSGKYSSVIVANPFLARAILAFRILPRRMGAKYEDDGNGSPILPT